MTLSLRTRILYGTSRVGSEALGRSQGLWLLYYLSLIHISEPTRP